MKPAPFLPATADLFRMDGMRILLTGAGGAIGTVLARAFADLGATVALHDISETKVAALAAEINDGGGSALTRRPSSSPAARRRSTSCAVARAASVSTCKNA